MREGYGTFEGIKGQATAGESAECFGAKIEPNLIKWKVNPSDVNEQKGPPLEE